MGYQDYLDEGSKKFLVFMQRNFPERFMRELNAYHARLSYRIEDVGEKYDITVAYDHHSGKVYIVDRAYESEIMYIRGEAEEYIEEELSGLLGRLWLTRIEQRVINQENSGGSTNGRT